MQVKLRDLIPHVADVIESVIFFDCNEEHEYYFDLYDSALDCWLNVTLTDWRLVYHSRSHTCSLFITHWD